jgi:hypothetical protein
MKKLQANTKAKLIYTLELAIFACLFLTLGILFLCGVLSTSSWKKWLVLTVGTAGAVWCFIDFVWFLRSPKKREKGSLLDKVLLLPNALYALVINIYFWVKLAPFNEDSDQLFAYILGASLCYFAIVYAVEAIYHWKYPVPGLLESDEEEEATPPDNPESENK